MANSNGGTIKFKVGLQEDKTSFNQLKASLQEIQKISIVDFKKRGGLKDELMQAQRIAQQLGVTLDKAFSPTLNSVNVKTFNQELQNTGLSLDQIYRSFSNIGPQGTAAFSSLATAVLTSNLKLKETHSILESMGTTLVNSLKWNVASSVINNITQTISGAFTYVKSLQGSLNDIRIVTGDSQEKMQAFAASANKAALALGRSTMDYTKAALTFYQQGLSDEEVGARTEAVLKAQNITGAGAEMADYLTAVWNGFQVTSDKVEESVDKLAAVADSSASDMSQLATAMSKVAPTAKAMGVDIDQLNAALATVVATTRQAPQAVGTAFKTIFTRMNDIKTGAEDAQVSLGRYSSIMASLGFNVLDASGNLRDTGKVMEEIGSKWADLTRQQQVYLATTMGGQRQITQIMALFENWGTYTELLNTSLQSQGALNLKNSRYMDSLGASSERLGAATERIKDALIDTDDLKDLNNALTSIVTLFSNMIESIGGGKNALLAFGGVAAKLFSGPIANEINQAIVNFQNIQQNKAAKQLNRQEIEQFASINGIHDNEAIEQIVARKQAAAEYYDFMTNAEIEQHDRMLIELNDLQRKKQAQMDLLQQAKLEDAANLEKLQKDRAQLLKEQQALNKQREQLETAGQAFSRSKKISFLGDNFIPQIQKAEKGIEKIEKAYDKFSSKVITTSQKQIDRKRADILSSDYLKQVEQQYKQLEKTVGKGTLANGFTEAFNKYQEAIASIQDKQNPTLAEINAVDKAFRELLNGASTGISSLNGGIDTNKGKLEETKEKIDELNASIEGAKEDGSKRVKIIEANIATLTSKIGQMKKAADEFLQGIKQRGVVQSFVKMAGGAAQLSSGILSLTNITKIWENETLSATEKIGQSISSLSFGLGSIWSGVSTVGNEFIKLGKSTFVASQGLTGAAAAAEMAKTGLSGLWVAIKGIAPYAAIIAAIGGVIAGVVLELTKEQRAAKKAAKAHQQAVESYEKAKNKLDELKSSGDRILSLQETFKTLDSSTKQWRDSLEEVNQLCTDLLVTMPQLRQAGVIQFDKDTGTYRINQEKYQEYLNNEQRGVRANRLQTILTNDNASNTNFDVEAKNLTAQRYGWSVGRGASTPGYTAADLATAAKNLTSDQIEAIKAENAIQGDYTTKIQKQLGLTYGTLYNIVTKGYDDLLKLRESINFIKPEDTAKDIINDLLAETEDYKNLSKTSKNEIVEELYSSLTDSVLEAFSDKNISDEEGERLYNEVATAVAEKLKEDVKRQQSYGTNRIFATREGAESTYGAIQDVIEDLKPGDIISKEKDIEKVQALESAGIDIDEFFNRLSDGTYQLKEDVTDFYLLLHNYGKKQLEQAKKDLDERLAAAERVSKIESTARNQIFNQDASDSSSAMDRLNVLKAFGVENDFTKGLINKIGPGGSLNEEQLKELNRLFNENAISAEDFDKVLKKLQEDSELLANGIDNAKYSIKTMSDELGSLTTKLLSDKTFDADDLNDYNRVLGQIKSQYPQLAEQVDVLNNIALKGTQRYSDALGVVQKTLNDLRLEELANSAGQSLDLLTEKITDDLHRFGHFDIDFSEFESAFDEIFNRDRKIEVEVVAQADDAFNKLKDEFDSIYQAAGKIGQNFVVARKDIESVALAFPTILQGMQTLEDGSVQLKQSVVQEAIAAASATTATHAESVRDQLADQAQMLRARAASYRKAADIAMQLAQSETASESEKAKLIEGINSELGQWQVNTSGDVSQQQQEDNKDTVDSSKESARIIATNYATSANESSKAFYIFATNAIENLKRIARAAQGQDVDAIQGATAGNEGDYFNGLTSRRSKYTEIKAGQISGPEQGQDWKTYWEDFAKKYRLMAEGMDASAQQIENKIALIGGETDALANGLKRVYQGKGIQDKSKNSGGSSGSTKDPDTMDLLDDQVDRYHDVNLLITDISKKLAVIQSQEKKLVGQDLINNLDEQLNLLDKQIEAYKTKISLAREEQAELQKGLEQQGVIFDSNTGAIANYTQIMSKKLGAVNAIIALYNTMSAEEQKGYKDTVEAAKKEYEKFKKQIQNYDKLISETIPDLQKNIQDTIDKQIEIKISKFNAVIKIELDLGQATRDWNAFKKKVLDQVRDDDILGGVRSMYDDYSSYYNDDGGQVSALTTQVNNILSELHKMDTTGSSDVYGDNRAKALEELKTYSKQLMSALEGVDDLVKDIKNSVYDIIDLAQDAFDKQNEEYSFIEDQLTHDIELVKLLYGQDTYQSLDKFFRRQQQNNISQIDFLKQQQDLWYQRIQMEQDRMKQLTEGSNEWKQANDRLQEYKKHWMDATKDVNSAVEKAVQDLTTKYANTIDGVFDKLNKKITGGKGLEYIGEEWQLINKEADMYLDAINAIYQVDKLEDAYKDVLNTLTDNVGAQQSLNNLMNEQLKYLRDKDKLTQYDVDRANMLLQIQQKRIALENASQSKSKLRLRRDSQGNYSYQYTADQTDINAARQELNDARNQLFNLTRDAYNTNLDSLYGTVSEYEEKLKTVYSDTTLSIEEQQEKIKLLNEYYGPIIQGLVEENENLKRAYALDTFTILEERQDAYQTGAEGKVDGFVNNILSKFSDETDNGLLKKLHEMYKSDPEQFKTLLTDPDSKLFDQMLQGMKKTLGADDGIVKAWESGVQQMADNFAGQGGFVPTTKDAFKELDQAAKDFTKDLSKIEEAAKTVFGDGGLKDGYDDVIPKAEELLDDNQKLIDEFKDMLKQSDDVLAYLQSLADKYKAIADAAKEAMTAAHTYQENESKKQIKEAKKATQTDSDKNKTPSKPEAEKKKTTDTSKTTTKTAEDKPSWDRVVAAYDHIYYGHWGNEAGPYPDYPTRVAAGAQDGFTKAEVIGGQQLINYTFPTWDGGYGYEWQYAKKLMGYRTGGYTGAWGNNGKLALLHEKELVLNAEDTKNILSAVNVVRSLDSLLSGLNANIPTLNNNIVGLNNMKNNGSNLVGQNVNITASFPNVSARKQIEDALNNLINRASQYAFNNNF